MKELLNLASKYKVPVLITQEYLAFYIGRLNTNDKLELRIDLEMNGYRVTEWKEVFIVTKLKMPVAVDNKLLESFVDRVSLKEVV